MGKRKTPKVIDRKLGRERALGQAYGSEKIIEIDPRLRSKRRLTVLIHEALHVYFVDMSESQVDRSSVFLSKVIWADNYRRIQR